MNAPFSFYGRFVDTLQNVISGLGTPRDKSYHTTYAFNVMTRAVLEAAYRGDWMARKIIDAPVEDATREWRAWQADGDAIEKIEKTEKDLKILKRVAKVMKQARLYGGAALILGVDGQGDASQPLDVEKVKQDQLKFIHVVASHEISVEGVEQDLAKPEYGEPLMYQSTSVGGVAQVRIHPTRVIRFVGKELPNERELGPAAWGDSILQVVDDAIRSAGTVLMAGAALVNDAKVDVIKVPDLSTNLTTAQYSDRFTSRIMLANQMKSVINTLVVDKEEEWARMQTNFAGMDELFKLYLLVASGAADIPATRLLGQAPQGMNATGESDIRNYYDRLRSEQETELAPALEHLDEILIRSATGTRDENIFYEWNPLWQLTDAERADVAVKKSQVMSADVAAGLIPLEVLRIGRQNQLVEDGFYPGIEVAIEEHEEEPSPAEENRQVANEALSSNENESGEEEDEDEPAFADSILTEDAEKFSAFVKVGPNKYKRKGGKGKIYNFNQVKLWYALRARGQAWDGDEDFEDGFDPNQPRDPKGTATGGQFASTGHGGKDNTLSRDEVVSYAPKFDGVDDADIYKDELTLYTEGYDYVQELLREDKDLGDWADSVARMDALTSGKLASTLERDATVYRAVSGMDLKEGSSFTDKGFVSTTAAKEIALDVGADQLMKINLPKGTKFAAPHFPDLDLDNSITQEIVLPRGSTYKVVGKDKDGTLIVDYSR